MTKKEESLIRSQKLFQDASNLQRFIHKYEEKFNKLTDREIEVLTLVAKGLQNPAIAENLDISRSTVQNHRAGIRKKLAVGSQADYIKFALAFGLISF